MESIPLRSIVNGREVSLNFEEDTGSTSKHIQQSYQLHDAVRNKQLINIPIGLDITLIDERNQTCLDIALENGDEAAVKILLDHQDWEKIMRRRESHTDNSPMQMVIKKMPNLVEYVFNKCVDKQDDITTYNYEFLDDMYVLPSEIAIHMVSSKKGTATPYYATGKLRDEAIIRSSNFDTIIKSHPVIFTSKMELYY
uniref:Uncharacterized protein n=1 Tax=Acrobeloides nanus TaxID=290746 RepID=A0A914CMF0_9BILA